MALKITHRLRAHGCCPVNGDVDEYDITLTLLRAHPDLCPMIEAIQEDIEQKLHDPCTQEELTAHLAQQYRAEVTTSCDHRGVETVCVATSEG